VSILKIHDNSTHEGKWKGTLSALVLLWSSLEPRYRVWAEAYEGLILKLTIKKAERWQDKKVLINSTNHSENCNAEGCCTVLHLKAIPNTKCTSSDNVEVSQVATPPYDIIKKKGDFLYTIQVEMVEKAILRHLRNVMHMWVTINFEKLSHCHIWTSDSVRKFLIVASYTCEGLFVCLQEW